MKKMIFVVLALLSFGCTDAKFGKFTNFGNSASIKCYSGGQVVYDGEFTGKVISEQNSDGYFFKEKSSGQFVEVSGNCTIKYK